MTALFPLLIIIFTTRLPADRIVKCNRPLSQFLVKRAFHIQCRINCMYFHTDNVKIKFQVHNAVYHSILIRPFPIFQFLLLQWLHLPSLPLLGMFIYSYKKKPCNFSSTQQLPVYCCSQNIHVSSNLHMKVTFLFQIL